MKSLRIRHASAADLQAICLIEDSSFSEPYPPHLLKRLMDNVRNSFLVAEIGNGQLVGYCVASVEGRGAHLISIAVLSEGRRKGVATTLLQNLIEHLKDVEVVELWLEVKSGNKEAIRLYEKLGFQGVMMLESYYGDGSSAIRMRMIFNKHLDHPPTVRHATSIRKRV